LVRAGKVLYTGISDAPAWWIAQANTLAQLRGWSPFIVAAVKAVSGETGRGMAQVALAWLRHRPVPVIPIIGARKLSQLQDNLASLDLALSEDQLKRLDEASRIEPGFPYNLYAKELLRAFAYGGLRDRILA